MDADFWLGKWRRDEIGFHEDLTHPMLCANWAKLGVETGATVFVPLCGKSRDMLWLAHRGHCVVGVELSEIAAQAFFAENGIAVECDTDGPFTRYRGAGITIICGDFFALEPAHLGAIDALYDRAALIALPDAMRADYATRLRALTRAGVDMLLVSVTATREAVSSPPFVVTADEIETLYRPWCDVHILGTGDSEVKGVPAQETSFHLAVR